MASPLEIFSDQMTVFGAAGRYVQGVGVVDRVGPCAAQLGRTALLLSDHVVLGLLEPQVRRSCDDAGVELRVLGFDGKLGPQTAAAIAAQIDRGAVAWRETSFYALSIAASMFSGMLLRVTQAALAARGLVSLPELRKGLQAVHGKVPMETLKTIETTILMAGTAISAIAGLIAAILGVK